MTSFATRTSAALTALLMAFAVAAVGCDASDSPLQADLNQRKTARYAEAAGKVKGAGRYIRTIRARAKLASYDAATGAGAVALDLMFTNDAPDGFKAMEAGSMCVRARGDAVLLQFDGVTALRDRQVKLSGLKGGERKEQKVDVCQALPAGIPCP